MILGSVIMEPLSPLKVDTSTKPATRAAPALPIEGMRAAAVAATSGERAISDADKACQKPRLSRTYTSTTHAVPRTSPTGSVVCGREISPPTDVRFDQPSYVHRTGISALAINDRPKPCAAAAGAGRDAGARTAVNASNANTMTAMNFAAVVTFMMAEARFRPM